MGEDASRRWGSTVTRTQDIFDRCTDLAGRAFPEAGGACTARDAALYLAHTGRGESIRALAEAAGTHPSTVLRAVRRVESRRDDPLIDAALETLGEVPPDPRPESRSRAEPEAAPAARPRFGEDEVMKAALRYLRRLNEPGSFLIVAQDAEMGGIFCRANDHRKPIAMIPVGMAAEFVKRDWVRLVRRAARSTRYELSDIGRAFLRRTLSEQADRRRVEGAAPGFAEAASPFQAQHMLDGERLFADPDTGEFGPRAVNLGETPLGWLARRKGTDGKAFLTPVEYEAGERLRCDFEAAQMGPSVAQDWRRFLTPGDRLSGTPVPRGPGDGPAAARDRVSRALDDLGGGLADVALRVCCFLEGLEATERRMGWNARSGKVVLKIALQRLAHFYGLA